MLPANYASLWQHTAGKFVSQSSSVSPLKIDQIIALFVFQTQLKLIPYLKSSAKSPLSSSLKPCGFNFYDSSVTKAHELLLAQVSTQMQKTFIKNKFLVLTIPNTSTNRGKQRE